MVACLACHAQNPAANKFCGECGARLSVGWPPCDHPNPPSQKFCGQCGAALEPMGQAPLVYTPKHLAEKILRSRAAIEGERKLVSVMFTDVSGFTAMSERLDPEEVHAIMDRAFQIIIEAVHRFEGTINQFLGDGVMALFGAPIAHEDHPHRALHAALTIQDGLSPLEKEVLQAHGIKFRVRMGINTGLVFVGAIGKDLRMDYTAVGDTTNLAARLLGHAGPGQIVVSAQTKRLTEGFFVFEDLGEFTAKGKTEPVHAYAVKDEIRGRTRLEVSRERGLTPLVGRDPELGRLTEASQRAAEGRGAIILVVGEPGMGKSRLLYEFLRKLDGMGVLELEATCLSYSGSIPYYPIVELLRGYLGLSERTSGDEVQRSVAQQIQALGFEGEEPPTLVAHFLGISAPEAFLTRLSGAQLKQRTFDVLRALLLRASETQPLVLVIENLHWLDPSSEEFLRYLAKSLPGHRILLLLSARPDFSAADWLAPPLSEIIAVEGLDGIGVRRMIQTLLGVRDVSEQLLKILLDKGDGNPLYVEEILRQLQETGGILIETGEARLRGADVRVPSTIHDIIAARIDRLADPVKHTLQVAAVVGRQFAVTLLSRVLKTDGDLAGHLRDLQTHDFIFLTAREAEPVYTFKHALTQEVAYASLLERRRRGYHAEVGVGLEELHAGRTDEVVELLAYHFGRSKEDAKAVDYSIVAGEKAQRRWANTEALAQFEAALRRLEPMPDTEPNRLRRIDAVVKQAEIKFALGRHAEHVQALEQIRDLVEQAADPRRRAAWYFWAGFLHSLTGGRPDVSIAYCREAVAIAEANGLEEIRAFAESCLTHVYSASGYLREGPATGERALATLEARGNVWWICRTLWGLMSVCNALGEWRRSLGYCRRALEYGQTVNDLRLKVAGWWRLGSTHVQRGDPETGLRCCEEALALSPIPFDAAMVKAVKGYGLIKLGRIEAGMTELTDALAWLDQTNIRPLHWLYAFWLAECYLRLGEPSRARALVEEILATNRESSRRAEGVGERLLGESLMPDDTAAAARHLETAMRILDEIGARNELAKALMARADLHRTAGDAHSARTLLERALRLFEELETLDEVPRARATLAALNAGELGLLGLLIVSREQRDLYEHLQRQFAGNPNVRVILDRRERERRQAGGANQNDRRRADRRRQPDVDVEIRSAGYAIIPDLYSP